MAAFGVTLRAERDFGGFGPRSRFVSRNEDESRSDDNEEIGEYSRSRKSR